MKVPTLLAIGVSAVSMQAFGVAKLSSGGWSFFLAGLVVFQFVVLGTIWAAEKRA